MRKVAYIVPAFVLTACGGGGGSDNPSPNSSASVNVSLTASTTSPYEGDSFTLNWSSNASSCNAGGDWTGNINSSGSKSLTIDTIKTNTYTITCTDNGKSASSTLTVTTQEKPYFIEVPAAFPDPTNQYWFFDKSRPANTFAGSGIASTAVDMNGDGRKEFVLVIHKGSGHDVNRGKYVSETCKSTTVVYEFVDNKFVDSSEKYLDVNRDFGACVDMNAALVDINKDGKLDIFFSTNQEDGRNPDLGSKMDSQLAGWVSQSDGKYKIIKFADSKWYHSIGSGIDSSGRPFVAGAGYPNNFDQNIRYVWNGNGLTAVNDGLLPNISPVTFVFKSVQSNTSDVLIQHTWDLQLGAEAYVKQNMTWRATNKVNLPVKYVRDEKLTLFSGDSRTVKILDLNGTNIVGTGGGSNLENLCTIKLHKDKDPVAVGTYNISKIKNYVPGNGIKDPDLYGEYLPVAFYVENGTLIYKQIEIKGETNFSPGRFQCLDVNKDGYDDLTLGVMNDRNLQSQRIYINNQDGTFTKLELGPKGVMSMLGHVGMYMSYMDDFDNDGKMDIVIYPSNITSQLSLNDGIKLYKGLKNIK